MSNNRNENAAADSGAYVLNALDRTEREEFEAQLAESEELRNEVTEMTDTAVLLGLAVTPVTPSPELKSSLMAKIATTPQLPREVAPVRTLRPVDAPAIEADEPPAELSEKAKARWFARPMTALTAVAAAVAIIVGGVVVGTTVHDNSVQSASAQTLSSITSAADYQRAKASISTGGKATLVWSETKGKAALFVSGIKGLPDNRTYELWYIDGKGSAVPAGTFSSSDSTYHVLKGTMKSGDTVGVTVEPAGGSDHPTTKPIVAIASA